MAYGIIVSGGPDGRYTIRLDFGEAYRLQLLAQATAAINALEIRLGTALADLAEAQEKEDAQRIVVQNAIAAYIEQTQQLPAGTPLPDPVNVNFERSKLFDLQVATTPLRMLVDAIKFDIAEARKLQARWNTLQCIEVRNAWCADLTEDRAPGSLVGTVEIPGEPALVLIAPGARGWQPSDGVIFSRELLRPDQAYVNAALLPGVLKWKPTYRRGVITAIDYEANTCNVSLDNATSSTRPGLSVNERSSLAAVPVTYMTCDANAFEEGDRVVVRFDGDWNSPRVIGFVDNPKGCNWPLIHQNLSFYYFESKNAPLLQELKENALDVQFKINSGAWQTMPLEIENDDLKNYRFIYIWGDLNMGEFAVFTLGVDFLETRSPASINFEMPPHIRVSGGAFPFPPRASRNVFEFRVRLDGELIFNVAILDMGFLNEFIDGQPVNEGFAKSPGGIALRSFPNSIGTNVRPLPDYILTGDEP